MAKVTDFVDNTDWISLEITPLDYEPKRKVYTIHVPVMGQVTIMFNNYENDCTASGQGVSVFSVPVVFQTYRNATPFKACCIPFNNRNGKCSLLSPLGNPEGIDELFDRFLAILHNFTSKPYYWVENGAKIFWNDPEGETSGVYEVCDLPTDIARSEWDDSMVIRIFNETSEAEVTLGELQPVIVY